MSVNMIQIGAMHAKDPHPVIAEGAGEKLLEQVRERSKKASLDRLEISKPADEKEAKAPEKAAGKEAGNVPEGTSLPLNADLIRKLERLNEAVKQGEEFYERQNAGNKKFPDPKEHIRRKYFDRSYKYYTGGLTNAERERLCANETAMLEGAKPHITAHDPALLLSRGTYGFGCEIDDQIGARADMDEAVNNIFRENGIVIPDGMELEFSVDPYDYMIKVSCEDEGLASLIEEALNKGDNGRALYDHIEACDPAKYGKEEPAQYKSNPWKLSVFLCVKQAGYDLRELERRDGKFLTPEGQDVWELVSEKYRNDQTHADVYRALANTGLSTEGSGLSIGYRNGGLFDLGTEYGYGKGQTAWISEIKDNYKRQTNEYMNRREDVLRMEERQPSPAKYRFSTKV